MRNESRRGKAFQAEEQLCAALFVRLTGSQWQRWSKQGGRGRAEGQMEMDLETVLMSLVFTQ